MHNAYDHLMPYAVADLTVIFDYRARTTITVKYVSCTLISLLKVQKDKKE